MYDLLIVSKNVQTYLDSMEDWYTKWRFKINPVKSIHTTFTMRLAPLPEVTFNVVPIPFSTTIKYLDLTLDKRLT